MPPYPSVPPRLCRNARAVTTRRAVLLASSALALTLMGAMPASTARADDAFAVDLVPMDDADLSTLRGGFRIGNYDFNLGAVVKTVIADAAGRLLEIQSQYAVPDIGVLTHLGTTITPSDTSRPTTASFPAPSPASGAPLRDAAAVPLPAAGSAPLPVNAPAGIGVSLPGTTILSHGLFNTFIQNTATDRVISHQTDLNMTISGLAQQALRVDAARLAGMTGRGQMLSVGR